MKLREMTNYQLLSHYNEAVCDSNYNPSSKDYNQSGYTLEQLENEILNRMETYEKIR